MINKDGRTIFRFYGGDPAVMRGDIELMGNPPVPLLGKTLLHAILSLSKTAFSESVTAKSFKVNLPNSHDGLEFITPVQASILSGREKSMFASAGVRP